jgi:hypothetical protein
LYIVLSFGERMKNFKYLLLVPLVLSSLCFGMYQKLEFNVNGRPVKHYDTDRMLQKMDTHQLRSFLAQGGKIRASRLDNGDYVVRAHTQGLGGGPIFGAITAIVTFTATGIAAVGTMVGVTVVTLNPVAGFAAGAAVGSAGAGMSGAATAAATVAPTP